MALARAKVYRNIELRHEWFGLEPLDCFALGGLLWLLVVVNRHAMGLNFLAVVISAAALRIVKRGKPANYSFALFRFFVLRCPFFSPSAPDTKAVRHPAEDRADVPEARRGGR